MTSILDEDSPHQFAIPPGIVKVATCRSNNPEEDNCRASCANGAGEYYIAGTEPRRPCNLARQEKNSQASAELSQGETDEGAELSAFNHSIERIP